MSSGDVTTTGFLVIGCATVLLLAAGRLGVLARAGEVLNALLARRANRVLIVLAWAWLGWHFLVRTG
jgi:Family of unknown function (DUF6186)